MNQGKAIEFKLDALETLRGPGVYMYVEGDKALYVGASKHVIGRVFARNHHVKQALSSATSMLIFPCDSWPDAQKLEACMIADLDPVLNKRGGAMVRARKICQALGITPEAFVNLYLSGRNKV